MDAFTGRVALVTGGSGGIGQCLAARLAGAGARVAVHYSRSAEAAGRVTEQITAGGGQAVAVAADLARPEAASAHPRRWRTSRWRCSPTAT